MDLQHGSSSLDREKIDEVKRDLTYTLAAIQSRFSTIISENPKLTSSADGLKSFGNKLGKFRVVVDAGSQLFQKLDKARELLEKNSVIFEHISSVDSLETRDSEALSSRSSSIGSVYPYSRDRSSSLDLPSIEGSNPLDTGPLASSLGLSPLLRASGELPPLPDLSLKALEPTPPAKIPTVVAPVESQAYSSTAPGKRKRVNAPSPQLKPELPIKPASSIKIKEIGEILERLVKLLKDIPEELRPLTSDEVEKFGIAYGSDEYVRFTELQGDINFRAHPKKVEFITRKIEKGLKAISLC